MKYLVTGASGFIGRHLCLHLRRQGHEVLAATRNPDCECSHGISKLSGTVMDPETTGCWIREAAPDVIVHLAAQSLPGVSWEDPSGTFDVNVNGTMNLLTAMKKHGSKARFVMVSSSSVYAPADDGGLIGETSRLEGSSPYAVSKLAAEQGALLYGRHTGLDVVAVRPFFIIGPGKIGDVSSDFARRVVAAERGETDRITVGNLAAVRDFLDIEDALSGMDLIVTGAGSGDVYNLCSGRHASIRDILDLLKSMARADIIEEIDPGLMRPIDEPVKVGDPAKLTALGWKPAVPLADSLRVILEYWRSQP